MHRRALSRAFTMAPLAMKVLQVHFQLFGEGLLILQGGRNLLDDPEHHLIPGGNLYDVNNAQIHLDGGGKNPPSLGLPQETLTKAERLILAFSGFPQPVQDIDHLAKRSNRRIISWVGILIQAQGITLNQHVLTNHDSILGHRLMTKERRDRHHQPQHHSVNDLLHSFSFSSLVADFTALNLGQVTPFTSVVDDSILYLFCQPTLL